MSDTSLVFALSARNNMDRGMRDGRRTVERETSAMVDAAESNGAKMSTALAAAGAAAGAGAAALLASTFEQHMDVSSATARLEAQLANSTADVSQATDAMTEVFTDGWGESASEVADAIKSVSLNMDDFADNQDGLEDMTKKALALADAFDDDINKATAAAGQMVKTGMAADFDEAMDLIAAGMSSVANKSEDLLDVFNEYSTQFRRLGLDGQTAMGLISQGLEAGARDADSVADAIGIFGEMALAGGDQVNEAFASIGINGEDIGRKMRAGGDEATEALQDTMDALRGTDDATTRLSAAQILFGDLANTQADALWALDPASAAAAGGFDDVAGAADDVVAKLEDSPAMKMQAFKRGVQQNVIDFLGGEVIPAVEAFKAEFTTAFDSVWEEAGAGGATGADRVVAAVEVIGVKIAQKIVDFAPRAVEAFFTFGQRVGEYVAANPGTVFKVALIATALVLALAALPALIAAGISVTAITIIGGFVSKLVSTLTEKLPDVWGAFTFWVATKAAEAGQTLDALGIAVSTWFWGLWDSYIAEPVSQQWNSWLDTVRALPGRTVTALAELGGNLYAEGWSAWNEFKAAGVEKAAEIVNWTEDLPGRIKGAVGSTGRLLYNKGRSVVTGLWNGMSSLGGWLYEKVGSFVRSKVVDAATSFLWIGSPSKLMADEVGRWIPPGIAQGAEDNSGVLDRAMRTLLTPPPVRPVMAPASGGTMAPLLTSGGARGQHLTIRLEGDRDLVRMVRRGIRSRGGDVTVLGQ
ncbi:hypothetical protein GCM10023347_34090 [Streptomyces chumphonensis]|uniref:Phage tail tape measure protein n=1 Tax=Streptomyces chumphonensis TaxID=1214925 RepID=A0A927ID48_9ACTN|nr:phage tail tape measure protein [Streptomyces chumphonensis]MBD3931921.1 phage tail tape measure protein [Streptomyces chumphonensis]